MKKLYIASGLVALLAAATACDRYDIYPEQYGKVMMIKDAGDRSVTIYATETAQPCYISVMKSGHTPEDPADATIKVLNDSEFKQYLQKYYGEGPYGLVAVNPDFYYLADANLNRATGNSLSHHFVDENDRYFGVNVVFDAQKYSDWWQELKDASEYKGDEADKLKEKEDALAIIQNKVTCVVPVGLFSNTDTINADNQYVMVMPKVEDPVMSVSINSGGYLIEDVSRSRLVEDQAFRNGVLEPTVTMSIPCSNPYGFSVQVYTAKTYIDQFAEFHTDIVLNSLDNPKGDDPRYDYCDGTKMVHFPAGKTEVKMPISIYRKFMDVDQLDMNYVIPFYLYPNTTKYDALQGDQKPRSIRSDLVWDNPNEVPDKVKEALKLPENNVTWEVKKDGKVETKNFGKYCFFVGYRVLETPLEITADNILYCNDQEPTEGSFEGLFDDDLATFFHSTWSTAVPRQSPYGSCFDVEIPTTSPINAVAFQIFARVHSNPKSPKTISLYYTSMDKYSDSDPDASYWTPFDYADFASQTEKTYDVKGTMGSGQLGWFGGIKKDEEWLRAYKYNEDGTKTPASFNVLRVCVLKNTKDEDCCTTSNASTGYWNLAGMKIYGTTIK